MSPELRLLAYSVALLIVLVLIQGTVGVLAQGGMTMAGARDNLPAPKLYQARTRRLVENHIEGLAMFAPLILIAAASHISDGCTVLGARLFFYSRVVHALAYLFHVPFVRTIAWVVGMVGTIMVLLCLFGII